MTTKDRSRALREFDEMLADSPESVMYASPLLQGQMQWLDHVADWEFSPEDRTAILRAYRAAYATVRPLVAKYIDGEEL